MLDGMDCTFNASLEASTKLVNTACLFSFWSCLKQDAFAKEAHENVADTNWTDTLVLTLREGNKTTSLKCTIGRPWRKAIR